MSRAKLTSAQIEQAVTLREKGWSYDRIAQRIDASSGAVAYQCLKAGAASPRHRYQPVPNEPRSYKRSDGRTCQRFTAEDDAQLLELRQRGLTRAEISRRTGRANTSITMRLMTLALREEASVG